MRLLGGIIKEVLERPRTEDALSFEEVCKAGKSVGLDPQDIIRLSKGSKATRIKSFTSKHLFIFVLIAAFVYLLFLITVTMNSPPTGPSNTYPAGTRYGVLSVKDFKKKEFFSKKRKDS